MLLETPAQVYPPGHLVEGLGGDVQPEPQGGLTIEVGAVVLVGLGIKRRCLGGRHDVEPRDEAVAEEGVAGLAGLGDDSVSGKGYVEDFACIGAQRVRLAVVAEGGRGADAAEVARRHLEAVGEAKDEAGQVGALRAVEGVEFIDDQVAQALRSVLFPQGGVAGPDEEIVEHLVVGEQDVRGREPQGVFVGDDVGWGPSPGGSVQPGRLRRGRRAPCP